MKQDSSPAGRGIRTHSVLSPRLLTVISITIAVILWIIAISDHKFTISMKLPVVYPELMDANFLILNEVSTESVTVSFTGSGAGVLIEQYFRHPVAVTLMELTPSSGNMFPQHLTHRFQDMDIIYSGKPFYVLQSSAFNPATIDFRIDMHSSRKIPVKVLAQGSIPERYFFQSLDTDSITLFGAASVLQIMDSVSTSSVVPGDESFRVSLLLESGITGSQPENVTAALIVPKTLVRLEDIR